jgi:hypothetical protein
VSKATVRISTRTVSGSNFLIKVTVPSGGLIAISGAGIGTAASSVAKAGAYSLRVALTRKMRKLLARRHRLALTLHVQFAAAGGGTSKVTIAVAVRRPHTVVNKTKRRAVKGERGGVR